MQDVDGLLAQARLDAGVPRRRDEYVVRRLYELEKTPLLAKLRREIVFCRFYRHRLR